jgi:hypothetical protein
MSAAQPNTGAPGKRSSVWLMPLQVRNETAVRT